jgi:hypothetical protein
MSRPKPTCNSCGQQHYNFVACEQADAHDATAAANAAARARVAAEQDARLGHINAFAGFKSKNFHAATAPGEATVLWRKRTDGRDKWKTS